MEFQEFEGKSTEDAIEQACAHFQVTAEQLEIEILSVGSPGLFGAEPSGVACATEASTSI